MFLIFFSSNPDICFRVATSTPFLDRLIIVRSCAVSVSSAIFLLAADFLTGVFARALIAAGFTRFFGADVSGDS